MIKLIHIEFYKLRHDLLIWGALLLVALGSICMALAGVYDSVYTRNPQIEYYLVIDALAPVFLFLTIAVMGYSLASDLQSRTVQNALSVGIERRKYYFAKLIVHMLLVLALFAAQVLFFTLTRLAVGIRRERVNTVFHPKDFALILFFMSLQVLAYCVLVNMICYFCRSQVLAIAIGLGWLIAEGLCSYVIENFHLEALQRFTGLFPSHVLQNCVDLLGDKTLGLGEMLKYGIMPAVIMVICGGVGYVWFQRGDNF